MTMELYQLERRKLPSLSEDAQSADREGWRIHRFVNQEAYLNTSMDTDSLDSESP